MSRSAAVRQFTPVGGRVSSSIDDADVRNYALGQTHRQASTSPSATDAFTSREARGLRPGDCEVSIAKPQFVVVPIERVAIQSRDAASVTGPRGLPRRRNVAQGGRRLAIEEAALLSSTGRRSSGLAMRSPAPNLAPPAGPFRRAMPFGRWRFRPTTDIAYGGQIRRRGDARCIINAAKH